MKEIDPGIFLTDVIMFDGASNVKLGGKLLKVHQSLLHLLKQFGDKFLSYAS